MGGRATAILFAAACALALVVWLAIGSAGGARRAGQREVTAPEDRANRRLPPEELAKKELRMPESAPFPGNETTATRADTIWPGTPPMVGTIPGLALSTWKIVGPDGAPVEGVRVLVRSSSVQVQPSESLEDGSINFIVAEGQRFEVLAWWPEREGTARLAPDLKEEIDSPVELKELELPPEVPPEDRGSVVGRVVDPSGVPAVGAFARIWQDREPEWTLKVEPDAEGAFSIPGLKPGPHRLEVHRDGHPTLHLKEIEVSSGATLDLGVLRLPVAARIQVSIPGKGQPEDVRIFSLDQRIRYNFREGVSEQLNAGRYLVMAGSPGQVFEVELKEGEQFELRVKREPTGMARFEFVREDGSAPPDLEFTLFDHADRWIERGTVYRLVPMLRLDLVAGEYLLRARDAGGFEGEIAVSIRTGEEPEGAERVLLRRPVGD